MGKKYVVYEKPDAADVFGSIIMFLAIAVFLGLLIFYLWGIVLIVFLCVGAAIGLGYALVMYIRALVNTLRSMGGYVQRSNGVAAGVLEKIWVVSASTASTAFHDNLSVASGALTRSHAYRLLSFRKWMWLFVALTVVVFGLCLICAVILLEFALVFAVAALFVSLLLAICAIYLVVAFFYAIIFSGKFTCNALANGSLFSPLAFYRGVTFREWGYSFTGCFGALGGAVRMLWSDTLTLSRDNLADARYKPLYSLYKWLQIVSPVTLFLWSAIYTALMCIFLTLIFIFALIAQFFWTCLSKLFFH